MALVDQAVAALELAGGVPEPQAGAAGTANGRRTRAGSAGYGLMQLKAIYSRTNFPKTSADEVVDVLLPLGLPVPQVLL